MATREPSEAQRTGAMQTEKVLDEPVDYDFKDATLAEVAAHFEELTDEFLVLDPAARRAGRLDPAARISGKGTGVPLREALTTLLHPLGLTFEVRSEVILITSPRP